jgi:phage terminase large subunit-like protein
MNNFLNRMESLKYDWPKWARPEQLPPPEFANGQKQTLLILSGRGSGKTREAAEQVRQWTKTYERVNIAGPTYDDVRDICVEGESGVLAVCPKHERPKFVPSRHILEWPNGAQSLLFSAEDAERFRGKTHQKFWGDEIASWRNQQDVIDQIYLGLRVPPCPQAIFTTTPRPTKLIKSLIADPHVIVVRSSTYANASNLAPQFLNRIISKYEGTRLGRQELLAEVLDDNPGALFTMGLIDSARVLAAPSLVRVVVAIDPSVSSGADADECGICVAGMDNRKPAHFYILDDGSLQASPDRWARRAVNLFHQYGGDRVIAEVNNGGDLVESTLRTVDRNIPYKAVHASRGKVIRAEPIAALYEQQRVHHVGSFAALEDEMCDWIVGSGGSPDRLDALVWALTELSAHGRGGFMDGWVGQALEQIATAKAEHPGMSAQEVNDRFNPLKTQPYDVADLDAQLKAQQQVPDNRFRSKSRTFGELKDLAMTNTHVTSYRTKLPDFCPTCQNPALARYDSWARCAKCGWDSRTVVATTPVVAPPVAQPRGGLLDFILGRAGF